MSPIIPGSSKPMAPGYLPNMAGAVRRWVRPIVLQLITQTTSSSFEIVETVVTKNIDAHLQPIEEKLKRQAVGDRSWQWWRMWSLSDIGLKTGDKIIVDNIKYTVMVKGNWSGAGYYQYDLVEGFQ